MPESSLKIEKTKLDGVLLITPKVFEDHRGEYVDLYNEKLYAQAGIPIHFVEDNASISQKNVLRGIHSDAAAWKLVSCLLGKLYLVIVNCDKSSKKFGAWQSFTLSGKVRQQVLVPPKYGVAHLALTDKIIFHYKQSAYYDPSRQSSYKWDDAGFKINWPIKKPILSKRDELGHFV